ncbi:hypothetical protein V6N13_137349 [Hibiscus sabdariffa]
MSSRLRTILEFGRIVNRYQWLVGFIFDFSDYFSKFIRTTVGLQFLLLLIYHPKADGGVEKHRTCMFIVLLSSIVASLAFVSGLSEAC